MVADNDRTAPASYSVVVVDDAADVRVLLGLALHRSGRFRVVGEGASGTDAVRLADRLHPDVVLLDVSMPGMDGLEALPRVLAASPESVVVMLSGFGHRAVANAAVAAGATGYISKELPLEDLADRLVQLVSDGGRPPGVSAAADTRREGAGRLLAEHQERFRPAFDQAVIGMASLTLAGSVVRINAALCHILGRGEHELVGRPFEDVVAAAERPAFVDRLTALADGARVPAEFDVALQAGETQVRVGASVVCILADQQPLYLFLQAWQPGRRESGERDAARARLRHRALAELLDGIVCITEPDGRCRDVAPRERTLCGRPSADLLGRSLLAWVHDDDLPQVRTAMQQAVAAGRPTTLRYRLSGEGAPRVEAVVQALEDPLTGAVGELQVLLRPAVDRAPAGQPAVLSLHPGPSPTRP